eukprot:Clim_evm32s210 gene=Clim_evmTU32s210
MTEIIEHGTYTLYRGRISPVVAKEVFGRKGEYSWIPDDTTFGSRSQFIHLVDRDNWKVKRLQDTVYFSFRSPRGTDEAFREEAPVSDFSFSGFVQLSRSRKIIIGLRSTPKKLQGPYIRWLSSQFCSVPLRKVRSSVREFSGFAKTCSELFSGFIEKEARTSYTVLQGDTSLAIEIKVSRDGLPPKADMVLVGEALVKSWAPEGEVVVDSLVLDPVAITRDGKLKMSKASAQRRNGRPKQADGLSVIPSTTLLMS